MSSSWFYITPFSINVLSVSILLLFMVYFLLRSKRKSTATKLLAIFLVGVTLVFISFFVIFSSLSTLYSTLAWWVIHAMVFASIALVQFAYHFPENLFPEESIKVLAITVVAACMVYPWYIYRTLGMEPLYSFEGYLYAFFNTPEIGLVIGTEILWVFVVFFRSARRLSSMHQQDYPADYTGESNHKRNEGITSPPVLLFKSRESEVRAIRNIAIVFLSPVIFIFVILMAYRGLIPWDIVAHILGSGFMVTAFIFVIIYINNSSEPTTFMVKLVGISLGTLLIVFGLGANAALMIKNRGYDRERFIELSQCKRAIEKGDLSIVPEEVVYIIYKPVEPREGARYRSFLLRNGLNIKSFNDDVKTEPEPVEGQKIIRRYRILKPKDVGSYYLNYQFLYGGSIFEVGYGYRDYRAKIHETALLLTGIILGSALFVIFVFPVFFRESLIRPLNVLMEGVRRVDEGDLGVIVPVRTEDEIGILSRSFNTMLRSILEAEKRLRGNLEYQTRLVESYSCFVPMEFLTFLKKESIIDISLGDHIQRDMTILFSDIRSFTLLVEKMTPKESFDFINDFLGRVGPIVRKYGGFIDKYIGDAIMALFPHRVEDAVNAAVAMQREVADYNKYRVRRSLEPISIGIGIHTGTLMMGTIGEEKRMEGTVISDAVNLTSRMEGLTKVYGSPVIISGITLKNLKTTEKYKYRFLDRVQVKGKELRCDIFEIFDSNCEEQIGMKLETRHDFEKAIRLYQAGAFSKAFTLFSAVAARNPEDSAASMYCRRCEYFRCHGIPKDWNGTSFSQK